MAFVTFFNQIFKKSKSSGEFPLWRRGNQLACKRMWVQSLASLSGSGIQHCHELRCRLKTWLESSVAVAVAPIQPQLGNLHMPQEVGKKKKKKVKAQNPNLVHQSVTNYNNKLPWNNKKKLCLLIRFNQALHEEGLDRSLG